MHDDKLQLMRDYVLRDGVETSSQVETNQSSKSNVKADVNSDEVSETDDDNLDAMDSSSLNGCTIVYNNFFSVVKKWQRRRLPLQNS